MTSEKKEELELYLEEFDEDYILGDEQRKLAAQDMRFSIVKGGHWEGFMEEVYDGRTKLELDMTNQACERFMGDFADNRVEVSYSPNDDATTEDDGKLLSRLYRMDARRGRGKQAMLSAVGEAARCGYGAVKLPTVYENDEDPEDERQRVVFEWLPNAYDTVIFDSNAKEPDKSDAKHVYVIYEYSTKAFKEEYPDAAMVSVDGGYQGQFDWNPKDSIHVAHRYEIKTKKTKMHTFVNAESEEVQHIQDEDLELVESDLTGRGWEKTKTKKVILKQCFKIVFSGSEILETKRKISGKMLPVIPIYAYRYYIAGKEYYFGLVRGLIDAQRLYNMEVSQAAEVSSTGNRDIPLIDARALKGFESHWLNGNIYDKQFLPVQGGADPVTGEVITPYAGALPAAQMSQTSAALMEVVSNYIKEATGSQLADISDVDMSGKAIRELVKRINLNTRSIWTNIETYITRQGEVYKSIANDIYSMRRSVKLLNEDGSEETAQLMKAALDDRGRLTEVNNIKKMSFECFASVGLAYETERAETVETIRSVIAESKESPAAAEYLPVLYSTLFETMSGSGLEKVKEFNRKKQLQMGLVEPKDQKEMQYLQSLNQPDPQAGLIEAATQQQLAEAEDLKARAVERVSKAEYNRAKAVESIENMKTNRIKVLRESISARA